MTGLSHRELEDYWGDSQTTPAALDTFFDEDSTVTWTGSGALEQGTHTVHYHVPPAVPDEGGGSILDNITDGSNTSAGATPSSSSSLTRSLGTLGGKLQDWRPPGVKKRGAEQERCSNCSRLEKEVAQLSSRLQASYSRQHVSLPPAATVQAMLQGQPYTLQGYHSLQDKRDLLQAAVAAADSDTVVAVLVFCRATLSRTLFLQELESRPTAARCYVTHLKQRQQVTEAMEVMQALGWREEAGLLRYRQCLAVADHDKRVAGLRQLVSTQLSPHYQRLIGDQIRLLERQRSIDAADSKGDRNSVMVEYPRASSVYDKPLLTTLYYCSMYHWGGADSAASSPAALRQLYPLTDRQYLWGVVRGRARVRHYYLPDQLAGLLQHKEKGVLGVLGGALSAVGATLAGTGTVRASLPPLDRLVAALKGAGAPDAVLASYLALVEPKETRLQLAQDHDVRHAVVEAYIALKDRDGLQTYMTARLPPGSADYIKADAALKTGRWR